MDVDISKGTKLSVFVVIIAVFAVVGWRVGAPDSFNKTLADAGLVQQAPAPAPVPTPAAVPEQEPAAPASPTPDPAPAPAKSPDHPQDTTAPH